MSNNFTYTYTYQHTCKYGVAAYILANAPFRAVAKKINGKAKIPFLGEGYYLWEENSDAAVRWGFGHYKNSFSVVEYVDMEIENELLLNLLDRRDIQYFNELKEIYLKKRPESKKWRLGVWIEFFKKLQSSDDVKFPFKFIKADENLPDLEENNRVKIKTYFADQAHHYAYLSPLLVVCVINKDDMRYASKSISHAHGR